MFGPYGKGIAKGLRVTLTNFLRKPITTQYPEENLVHSKRLRGVRLVWDNNLCTGCATCAKSCPQGNIVLRTSRGNQNNYVVEQFELDTGRCIFCGLCVESCPYNALFFSMECDTAAYDIRELVLSRDQLTKSSTSILSAYYHSELEDQLPDQTLLLDRQHKGLYLKLDNKPKASKTADSPKEIE